MLYAVIVRVVFLFGCCALLLPSMAAAQNKVNVVATFSVLSNIASEVGGNRVEVNSIIQHQSDAHSFEPSPQIANALSKAQVLVSNGLGFETWLDRIMGASGFKGLHVVASNGVLPINMKNGQPDPHAWQNMDNGIVYAKNIANALSQVDPDGSAYYTENLKAYTNKITKANSQLKEMVSSLPDDLTAITDHDAFAYFGDAYGVRFVAAAAASGSAEPSARQVAKLVDLAHSYKKVALFIEAGSNPRFMQQLGREANVSVAGPLYADTLALPGHLAHTYIGMFEWNIKQLVQAFSE